MEKDSNSIFKRQTKSSQDLRIAIVIEAFPAMKEIFICRHIAELKADVVAVRMDEADLKGWVWKPYVACLSRGNRSKESIVNHILRRLRVVTLGIPVPRWLEGMEDIWEQYVRDRKPDVALAEFGPNGMCAMDACRRHEIPLVVHFHGYDASSMLRFRSYRECLSSLFEQSAAVVVVSQLMKKTLQDLGCSPKKLHVIPCGAPVDEFQVTDAVTNQPCRFLTVASFTPMKGSLYTLRAFAQCASQCPDVTLTMIGDGKQYAKAKKWVQRMSMTHKIRFLGFQPIEVVREQMAKSSVFVQHSVTTRIGHIEGWGVSIAEAASTGLPVITTNHGGIPDQVVDGKTGFLVEERDWETMANKMVTLARNPELRRKMGLSGRHNIEKVGNFNTQIHKLSELLANASRIVG